MSTVKYMEIRDWLVMRSPVICPRCYTVNRGVTVGHTKILKATIDAIMSAEAEDKNNASLQIQLHAALKLACSLAEKLNAKFNCDFTMIAPNNKIEKIDVSCTLYSKS